MTTTSTTLHLKVQRSRFAQHALSALSGLMPAAWRGTAERELSTAAREAAAVRELAYGYAKTDPGFADDLYAAANRHEALYARG